MLSREHNPQVAFVHEHGEQRVADRAHLPLHQRVQATVLAPCLRRTAVPDACAWSARRPGGGDTADGLRHVDTSSPHAGGLDAVWRERCASEQRAQRRHRVLWSGGEGKHKERHHAHKKDESASVIEERRAQGPLIVVEDW